jgi:hypothetical protein
MARTSKPVLAVVLWEDACYREGTYAHHIPYTVESVGWILQDSPAAITLGAWHALAQEDCIDHYEQHLTIPRGMVKKVTRIRA